jgi:hypothetical protein
MWKLLVGLRKFTLFLISRVFFETDVSPMLGTLFYLTTVACLFPSVHLTYETSMCSEQSGRQMRRASLAERNLFQQPFLCMLIKNLEQYLV